MNTQLLPTRNTRADVRADIAAKLASFYKELSGLDGPHEPYSLARYMRALAANRGPTGREKEVAEAAALLMDQHFDPNRAWVPFAALTRALSTIPGGKGGYLVGTSATTPVDVMRPWSVAMASGVSTLLGLQDNVPVTRVSASTTAVWFAEGGAAPTETPPSLGSTSLTPHTAMAFVKFSMQLLRQGEAAEQTIQSQLLAAVGELLDKAFFAGAGGVEPLGLLQTTGIGTQAGTALAHAGVLAMRRQVLAAGGREDALAWVGTPAVQELLGARERATGGGRFLWDSDGVLGRLANATKNTATGALVCGDFSKAVIGIFGPGIRIDVDPSQDFNSAGLVARVMLMCDVAFPQPSAFSVATSVT